MNRQPDLDPNIFRVLDTVIEDKPVSKAVLDIVIKLVGFDRGAVFLVGKKNELKLAVSLRIEDDRTVVERLVRRSGSTASSPVEYEPDTTKLRWFRTAHQLKDSFILSYACVAIASGKKRYRTIYLDSETRIEPIKE